MSVPGLTIAFIVLSMFVGVAIPVGLCIFCRVRWKCDFLPFFAGCGAMIVFAFGLEQIVHTVVFLSPAGSTIKETLWLYALYGGLMAGLFEETGRFLAMKFLLKKRQGNDYNAVMYGAGHGGIEAFVILFFVMLNNLIYSLMINSGTADQILKSVDTASAATLQSAFETLAQSSPFLFLVGPVERLAAVTAQIALSVLVWIAVKKKGQIGLYFLAVFLHFLLDAAAVVLSGLGVPVALVELAVIVVAAMYAVLAGALWKKNGLKGAARKADGQIV